MVKYDDELEQYVLKYKDMIFCWDDEPDEDDNTEWHLAAAIPRSELVFDNINTNMKIQ